VILPRVRPHLQQQPGGAGPHRLHLLLRQRRLLQLAAPGAGGDEGGLEQHHHVSMAGDGEVRKAGLSMRAMGGKGCKRVGRMVSREGSAARSVERKPCDLKALVLR
jgi:hypothetical protein